MRKLVALQLANLLLSAPPGATPPPGGSGPVAGDLTGRWEIRIQGVPKGFPRLLIVRLAQHQTLIQGEVLRPASRAFITGKMLGRFYMVEVRPLTVKGATASYEFGLSLDPTSTSGLGSVRARLDERTRHTEAFGSLEMRRLEPS